MRNSLGKRLLSLTLVLELLCAPVAMAKAEDPTLERREVPQGEEVSATRTQTGDLPVSIDVPEADAPEADAPEVDTPAQAPSTATGASDHRGDAVGDADITEADPTVAQLQGADPYDIFHMGLGFGQAVVGAANPSITRYGGYFKQESALTDWGSSGGASTEYGSTMALKDGYLYFMLPDLGRVPGMELEGFYLTKAVDNTLAPDSPTPAWVTSSEIVRSWVYDEAHPENYIPLKGEGEGQNLFTVPEADVNALKTELALSGTGTLVYFPESLVTADPTSGFAAYAAPDEDAGTAGQWSVPIVARWVPSSDSDMTMFAIDVAGTYPAAGGGTEKRSETVTDLYTKPFREAEASDHITAGAYQAEYLAQTEEELANSRNHSETRTATVFTPEPSTAEDRTHEYYLRVEEEQDTLTLRFLTQEPGYDYHIGNQSVPEGEEKAPCPVDVTATFAGTSKQELSYTLSAQWGDDGQPFFPRSLVYGTTRSAQNNVNLPARGQWTVADIPLKKVSEAGNAHVDPFNTITVTITAPDETKSTYIFHVERLMTPEITLGNGNTPAGMILRDDGSAWESTVEWGDNAATGIDPATDRVGYNKASALNFFKTHRTFTEMPIKPSGSRNQRGAIYMDNYNSVVWYGLGTDPDVDSTAIVAYQDAAFDDPGVSFVDSEGRKVVFGSGDDVEEGYADCVTRKLELRCDTALTVDSYADGGQQCWYINDANGRPKLVYNESEAAQVLRNADGSDPVDLRGLNGLNIVPGVYTAVYTFEDPVSDDVLEARRTVIVLPVPGDVDMDGAVTTADAAELDANAATWATQTGARFRLLRNRIYGMNVGPSDDRAVLNATAIRRGFQPIRGDSEALGYSDYMYLPLPFTAPAGDLYHARKTWQEVGAGTGGAKLQLVYLGTEQGEWNKANGEVYTNDISGPWASPADQGVSIVSGDPIKGTGDVFWMGVYVEDPGDMSGRAIQELSVSLVYDSEYVRPAVLYAMNEWNDNGYTSQEACWKTTTLMRYNLRGGSFDKDNTPMTLFAGKTTDQYTLDNSDFDRPYTTHYSKVEGDLELEYTDDFGQFHDVDNKLKEVVFSLQGKSGQNLATMEEGYLLVVPFQLIRHPNDRMVGEQRAQLVELAGGMRDFNVVLSGSARSRQGLFDLFSAEPRAAAGSTYAFSAQDSIYGGTTQNIRDSLTYAYDYAGGVPAQDSLVPIGKDNTVRILLTDKNGKNAVYDTSFTVARSAFTEGRVESGKLPDGLELDSTTMTISGTPTRAGTYDFTIKGVPYRIIVEKKTIHYRAGAANTYYGEMEYRGPSASRDPDDRNFTFTYTRSDLSDRDLGYADDLSSWSAEAQGSSDELEKILGRDGAYVAPVFQAREADNMTPVGQKTNVGNYNIIVENTAEDTGVSSVNYKLVYDAAASGTLAIQQRPVWLSSLNVGVVTEAKGSIYNDDTGRNISLTAKEEEGKEILVLGYPDTLTPDANGVRYHNGNPLTGSARVEGDLLELRYNVHFLQNQGDEEYEQRQQAAGSQVLYHFYLERSREERDLDVYWIDDVLRGERAGNYAFMSASGILHKELCDVRGTVVRRGVEAISIMSYPDILQYAQGAKEPNRILSYGSTNTDHKQLYVTVTRGAGDGKQEVGSFVYDSPLLQPMELHYNWVSKADKELGSQEINKNNLVGTGWDPGDKNGNGKEDERPYNGTDVFTPDMDGYYLCVAVKKYESNPEEADNPSYIKVYSKNPIHVNKKTIVLTPKPLTRFYGESNDALEYTYDITGMTDDDQKAIKALAAQGEATLTGDELESYLRSIDEHFVAPTLEASKVQAIPKNAAEREANRVDAGTPVGGGQYYILLYGGSSTNYTFAFSRPREDGSGSEIVSGKDAFGYSTLTVMQRPIVVSDVFSAKGTKADFETIYADTKNLYLTDQSAPRNRINFTLPTTTATATTFFRHGTGGSSTTLPLTFADNAEKPAAAVLGGDDVSLTYSVRFMCDTGHFRWKDFTTNYYSVEDLSALGGSTQKDVVIADMVLTGADAVNYELVYQDAAHANRRAPSNTTAKNYPDPTNNGWSTQYLIHGTGLVTLRQIKALVPTSIGQVDYTYGDTYAPYAPNPVTKTAMSLMVEYETAVDEAHANRDLEDNIHEEPVVFTVSKETTSFAQRGFTIYYLRPGQTTDEAIAAGQILTHETVMLPGEHDGASIFVTGQRRVGDPLVTSLPSDLALDPPQKLKVAQRELTFTVRDAHRYYGETRHVNVGGEDYTDPATAGSTEFTFSFPVAELAQRDREELARLKGVSVDALPTEGSEEDLRLLALSSRAVGLPTPTYTPDPGPTAPVTGDGWGEYEIDITPKDMDNYKVAGKPGTLYVYPRPVQVYSVLSSADDPVFTIYNQSSTPYMTTQMDTTRVIMQRSNVLNAGGQEVDNKIRTQLCEDGVRRALPLTGDAMVRQVGGELDSLIFTVRLYFYPEEGSAWDLDATAADDAKPQVEATFRSVSNTPVAKNYAVTNVTANEQTTQKFEGLWGAVKLRTIDEIFITGLPKTGNSAYGDTYTYGDVLNLTGLEVLIRYKALQGTGETVSVKYLGADQFRGYGLYVNYWYPGDAVPGGHKVSYVYDDQGEPYKDSTTTTDAEDALRKALPTTYRRADSGDHLTIAPTHDTQRFIGAAVDPSLSIPKEQQRPFAANGKYLIISAYQEGEKQAPAVPKIIGAPVIAPTTTGFSYENADEPIAIQVLPKQLRYTLSATDKTYDGTPRTAGTLTLTNVFDKLAQVKIEDYTYPSFDDYTIVQAVPTEETITDVVYVPMGALYENHGTDYANAGYDPYRQAIDGGKVAFTTGSYQPNGQAPLETNGVITWANGYEWGKGLTFTFPNANVHYLEEGEETPRAIGTQELADYWVKSQTHNAPSGRWDGFGTVCAMPVEVTGMALAGPDAANYTWATDGTVDHDTQVTMTTRAKDDQATGRSAAPYATIHKANRSTIQTLAGQGAVLPYLEVDEHTNAVRLYYTQALSAMGDNNNILGTTDEFSDELHFEYALFYDKDGLLTQWGGWDGQQGYQDTTFFGGELVKVETPAGYVPDYTRLPDPIKDADKTAKRGQHYQWAELDTGVSNRVHRDTGEALEPLREDAGVIRDLDAYPGGAAGAESYKWYYDLYTWGGEGQARVALPRNTVFYPLVRLSETHNYNASGNLTGSNDVTAQQLDQAQKAMAKLDGADDTQEMLTDAQQASANVFQAAAPMAEAARKVSQDRVNFDAELALAKRFPESGRPALGTAPAIKTFQQRFDILSTVKSRSADRSDTADYVIPTLEDVCFTDTLFYPEEKNMNAVLYNEPVRYYGYFWDPELTAEMVFGKEPPIDFGTEMTVVFRRKSETGAGMVDVEWTYLPEASNHTAQIYVKTTRGGGESVRALRIVPSVIHARLGDAPMQLSVVMTPELPSERHVTWATTNASVATVDQHGMVTFRGEGMALITATTRNGLQAVAVVTVSPFLPLVQGTDTLFNFGYGGPWAWLDGTYAFRPKEGMTRGQLVELLNIFLDPKAQWQTVQELAYVDVTGREKYYDALKRLTGAGVVTGIPGGYFAGDQLATRAEFVAMLSRMLKLDVVDTRGMAHAFADTGEDSTWAYAYIDALAKTGVIRGVGFGDFAPNRVITREETAAIIARLLTTQIDMNRTDLLRPSDVAPENWSYAAVLRAVNTVIFPD